MKIPIVIGIVTLLIGTSTMSCNMMDCVSGTGASHQNTITMDPFDAIAVEGAIDVIVTKGDHQEVSIEGQSELIELVNTKVAGGKWHITTSKCYMTNAPFVVHVVTPMLSSITVEGSSSVHSADVFGSGNTSLSTTGSGDIEVEGINEKTLNIEVTGSGSISVRGTCTDLDGSLSGSGDLLAKELTANAAKLSVEGSGSATITAITSLEATVMGSGDVQYGGKPTVNAQVEGSGSVTPLP